MKGQSCTRYVTIRARPCTPWENYSHMVKAMPQWVPVQIMGLHFFVLSSGLTVHKHGGRITYMHQTHTFWLWILQHVVYVLLLSTAYRQKTQRYTYYSFKQLSTLNALSTEHCIFTSQSSKYKQGLFCGVFLFVCLLYKRAQWWGIWRLQCIGGVKSAYGLASGLYHYRATWLQNSSTQFNRLPTKPGLVIIYS